MPNGEECEERGKRGGETPLHAKTTAQIGITEHPQFFGMKISVMEAIQDEPFERFMSYFLMQNSNGRTCSPPISNPEKKETILEN